MPPALTTTRGVDRTPKAPSSLTPGHTPTPTAYKERACSLQQVNKQGDMLLVLTPLCCIRNPSKVLPEKKELENQVRVSKQH